MFDLPATAASLDSIHEDARKFYAKSEDGATYNLDPKALASSFFETSKALKNERKIRSDFEKRSKEFEGFDKDEYERLRAKQSEWDTEKEQREREALEAKGKYEEALAKAKETHAKATDTLKADHAKIIAELTGKVTSAEGSKRSYILDDQVRRAIIKSGVFADDIDDVLTLTKNRFDLDENNNVVVKDEAGKPLADTTIDAYFGDTFKKARPKFYQGSGASGSGSQAGKSASNGGASNTNTAEMSSLQKISAGLAQKKR